VLTRLSHQELTLLVFVLDGGPSAKTDDSQPSCEEACPVVEHFEQLFDHGAIPHEKQLSRHLSDHLRQGLAECGYLDVMGALTEKEVRSEDLAKLEQMNERLKSWSCEIKLEEADRRLLAESLARLPRSAWISMPRTLWRLKKKLKVS
jgi:hypothetical protein